MSGEPSAQTPATASQATGRERWELVQRLFYAAIDVSAASRDGFVRRACEGDTALEAEVNALIEADLAAGDYLEQPLVEAASLAALFEPPLAPGDVLCDRFQILRSIAEGGMGHVFEALDRELNVHVALKVIRPEIAAVPEALARFRQEVRLARAITHPNVCRTFDIDRELRHDAGGRQYEIVFLTMELLAGETLAARIQREGPLKLDETLELAQQMAAALDAAHALGVVHRDMKPANVILVPVGPSGVRVVITDFGLARIDPVLQTGSGSASPGSLGPASLSLRGQPIGTLAYMAPEQLEARPVSPATDVYGFGLILFEMVTGRRAFPSENLLSGLTQRLTGAPPSARAFAASLPPRWNYAIESCLQVKPSERPRRAGQVAAVLEGRRGRLGMLRNRLRAVMRTQRGRWVAAAAAMLLGVSLFAGGVRLYDRATKFDSAAKVAAGALVYLAPVKNQTGEARLDDVTELLEAGLAQSAQINLLDRGKVGDILEHMTKPPDTKIDPPIAREIAMRAGAVRVVFATLTGSPSSGGQRNYKLQMEVQQPDNSPTLFRKSVKRTFAWTSTAATATSTAIPPELLSAVRDASDWVRHEAGESAGDIARLDVPPEDVTTSSWEALADYTRAEALRYVHKDDDAIAELMTAVRKDPTFALAQARLGDILVSEDDASGYGYYLKALELEGEHSLSLRERDRIQGIYASDTRDFHVAEDAFREYASFYPHDYLPWFYQGYPLMMLDRGRDAVRVLMQAHEADPKQLGAVLELAQNEASLGDFSGAERWTNQLRSMGFPQAADYSATFVAYASGNLAAIDRMKLHRASGEFHDDYTRLLADAYAERGHYHEALAVLNDGLAAEPGNGWLLMDRADLRGRLGDVRGCVQDIDSSIRVSARADTLMDASRILGRVVLPNTRARREVSLALNELEKKMPVAHYGLLTELAERRIRGEALLVAGDTRNALRQFEQAAQLDAPRASRDYLGRALTAEANKASDAAVAKNLRLRAMAAYAPVALHDGPVWQWQERYPPGFYADQLDAWLSLARATGTQTALTAEPMRRLQSLRPRSLPLGPS